MRVSADIGDVMEDTRPGRMQRERLGHERLGPEVGPAAEAGFETGLGVCTALAELEDLTSSWEALRTFRDMPMARWLWVAAYAETLRPSTRIFVPVVYRHGEPAALAPLCRPRGLFAAVRQIDTASGEPADFSYKDGASLDLLAQELARRRVPLSLERVPSESPVIAALKRAYRRRALVVQRARSDCPYIDIAESEEATYAALPPRLRSDLRRASRRAEQSGGVSVEIHGPATEDDLLPIWDEAVRIEAAGWKGRAGSALVSNPRVGSFYRLYALRACERGILRILLVKLGGQGVASMIALEAGDRLWILKIGYDERFAKCSPGLLVMEVGLRYAARKGLRSYEFLGTDADWIHRWTDRGWSTCGVFIYPYTLPGVAVFARDAAGFAWRKVRRRRGGDGL